MSRRNRPLEDGRELCSLFSYCSSSHSVEYGLCQQMPVVRALCLIFLHPVCSLIIGYVLSPGYKVKLFKRDYCNLSYFTSMGSPAGPECVVKHVRWAVLENYTSDWWFCCLRNTQKLVLLLACIFSNPELVVPRWKDSSWSNMVLMWEVGLHLEWELTNRVKWLRACIIPTGILNGVFCFSLFFLKREWCQVSLAAF